MRLGPFDIDATAHLDAIYSSNVEGEYPDEQIRDPEDFYLVPGLSLSSASQVGPRMNLLLDTGYRREIHFNRSDLDVDLGYVRGLSTFTVEPFDLSAGAFWDRNTEFEDEDTFVPSGVPDTKRKVETRSGYDVGLVGDFLEYVNFGLTYSYVEERYESKDFAAEENNETTFTYYIGVLLARFVSLTYTVEDTTTDYINEEDGKVKDSTETILITMDQLFGLLERPRLTYSIGVQREDEGGESEGWEFVHIFDLSDEYDLSPVLHLRLFAMYQYEPHPEEDDVSLQYGLVLDHELSDRTHQSFSATRQPVQTFGSTDETEETVYAYDLRINDFLLPNVSFNFAVSYEIDKPVEGDEERIWNYLAGVAHTKVIGPKLSRSLSYQYTQEDSNLESEPLEEHLVTLSYTYQF